MRFAIARRRTCCSHGFGWPPVPCRRSGAWVKAGTSAGEDAMPHFLECGAADRELRVGRRCIDLCVATLVRPYSCLWQRSRALRR